MLSKHALSTVRRRVQSQSRMRVGVHVLKSGRCGTFVNVGAHFRSIRVILIVSTLTLT